MKKARKGFTLVELMIVIGIISILGVMGIMAGGEATAVANASKIVEDFKMLGSAMNLYYADNKASFDKAANSSTGVSGATIVAGLSGYVKDTGMFFASGDEVKPGVYSVVVSGDSWWLGYGVTAGSKVSTILKNKAYQEGLMSTPGKTNYNGEDKVYWQAK